MRRQSWAFPAADEFMRMEIRPDGSYQRDHLEAAMRHVTNRYLAIDGGAHVGTWSKLMSDAFGCVIAIEPAPDTFAALQMNMRTFNCVNVTCRQAALGASAGRGAMSLDAREAMRRNTGARYMTTDGQDVEIVAVDDLELGSLGLLKLDVEGSEPNALRGAVQTLERCQPIVLFENKHLWRRYGEHKNAPAMVLQSVGYGHLQTIGCDEIWGPA